jgi:hypothetical protein
MKKIAMLNFLFVCFPFLRGNWFSIALTPIGRTFEINENYFNKNIHMSTKHALFD